MSGLSFALGAKRSAAASKAPATKKPAHVSDLFGAESDEEGASEQDLKKQRSTSSVGAGSSSSAPDPEVMKAAERLAEFVAKNGRSFEDMTRLRNPGNDTPFRFLHNKSCAEYKFFDSKVRQLEATMVKPVAAPAPYPLAAAPLPPFQAPAPTAAPVPAYYSQPTPAAPPAPPPAPSAPAGARASRWSAPAPAPAPVSVPVSAAFSAPVSALPVFPPPPAASSSGQPLEEEEEAAKLLAQRAQEKGDSVAAMDAYMKLMAKRAADKEAAEAEEDRRRNEPLLNETSFDRRKVVAVYKNDGTRGHHMSDFIPPEELAKLLAKGGDEGAKAAAEAMEKRNAIKEDNIGHKLLQKMGWKEGEGIGAAKAGITAPIQAGGMNQNNLGLGAQAHGEVNEGDDPFEQYRKRMMLGYKHRPNPLGNPRKAYY